MTFTTTVVLPSARTVRAVAPYYRTTGRRRRSCFTRGPLPCVNTPRAQALSISSGLLLSYAHRIRADPRHSLAAPARAPHVLPTAKAIYRRQSVVVQPLDGQYWLNILRTKARSEGDGDDVSAAPGDRRPDAQVLSDEGDMRRVTVYADAASTGASSFAAVRFDLHELTEQEAGLGHAVWPASVCGASWLARMGVATGKSTNGTPTAPALALRGDILELGSGVGVFGIAAGAAASALWRAEASASPAGKDRPQPPTLTLSDLSSVLVENLERNLEANAALLDGLAETRAIKVSRQRARIVNAQDSGSARFVLEWRG